MGIRYRCRCFLHGDGATQPDRRAHLGNRRLARDQAPGIKSSKRRASRSQAQSRLNPSQRRRTAHVTRIDSPGADVTMPYGKHWADTLTLRDEVRQTDGSGGDLQMSLAKAIYQTVPVPYA